MAGERGAHHDPGAVRMHVPTHATGGDEETLSALDTTGGRMGIRVDGGPAPGGGSILFEIFVILIMQCRCSLAVCTYTYIRTSMYVRVHTGTYFPLALGK